jgi:hypothetical protein
LDTQHQRRADHPQVPHQNTGPGAGYPVAPQASDTDAANPRMDSEQLAGFVKFQARTARMKLRGVSITEIAKEV